MAALTVQTPYPVFQDLDGTPLEDGYIYIGTAGLSPISNPITVYWDKDLLIPASQPIRTIGGYASQSGSPGQLFVDATDYSITAKNKDAVLVWTELYSTYIGATAGNIPFTQNGTGAVERTVDAKLKDFVNVRDFGVTGDGVTDDLAALQNAITYAQENGYELQWPSGVYRVTDTIEFGDGTDSSRSTVMGVRNIGAVGGVGQGEFGPPNEGVRILYDGVTSTTTPVIRVNGPIHSGSFENFVIDCNNKAGVGISLLHTYQYYFRDVQVEQYTTRGWELKSRTQYPAGVTQGAFENTFICCHARNPTSTAAETGFYMDGYSTNNIGCSRNVFINCLFLIGGDGGTRGIYLGYTDNNVFIRVTLGWSAATTLGAGVYRDGSGDFPQENQFIGCSLVGGITNNGSSGTDSINGYMLSDGAPFPPWDGTIKSQLADGRLQGGWTGSLVFLVGRTDGFGSGLGSTDVYLAPSGETTPNAVEGVVFHLLGSGMRLVRFRTFLEIAPGSGNTRTFVVRKNGANTSATTFYNSGENGDKNWSDIAGVSLNGGDFIDILSSVNASTPANGNLWFVLEFYPLENPT